MTISTEQVHNISSDEFSHVIYTPYVEAAQEIAQKISAQEEFAPEYAGLGVVLDIMACGQEYYFFRSPIEIIEITREDVKGVIYDNAQENIFCAQNGLLSGKYFFTSQAEDRELQGGVVVPSANLVLAFAGLGSESNEVACIALARKMRWFTHLESFTLASEIDKERELHIILK